MEILNPNSTNVFEGIPIIADPFIPQETQQRPSKENYWMDSEGNLRREIIEKVLRVQRGQY